MRRIKNNPMIKALLSLRGNPRACVFLEPLWGIPYNLYIPFVSVYMAALGVTDRQIGIVASTSLFFRAATALLSGAITDKLGRRRATIIFDLLSWSLPCLIWAFSQNFWWFMVAAAFNGLWQITENSWTCLLVEDADKSQLVSIYSWIQVSTQMAVFFAPLSGLLVNRLALVPTVRILYLFSFLSMTAKFVILYLYCDETQVGKVRLAETKGMSLFKVLGGYRELVPRFFRSPAMRSALVISALFTIIPMIMQNFFGLYTTKNLMIPEEYLALFPIIRSAIMLVFLFSIQTKLSRFGFKGPMLAGIVLYIASHVVLIWAPGGSMAVPVIYTVLESCAHGLVIPRKDSIIALYIDPEERARIISIMTVVVLGVSIPFGYIAGLLSGQNRAYPFVLNILFFVTAFLVIAPNKILSKKENSQSGEASV